MAIRVSLHLLAALALLLGGCALSPEARSLLLRSDRADAEEILRSLEDPLPSLRCDAALACARSEEEVCMHGVERLLGAQEEQVRACAMEALALRCDDDARSLLLGALEDPGLHGLALKATARCRSGDAIWALATGEIEAPDSLDFGVPIEPPDALEERLAWARDTRALGRPNDVIGREIVRIVSELEARRRAEEARRNQIEGLLQEAQVLLSSRDWDGARQALARAGELGEDVEERIAGVDRAEGKAARKAARRSLERGDLRAARGWIEIAAARAIDVTAERAAYAASRTRAIAESLAEAEKLLEQGRFAAADRLAAQVALLGGDLADYQVAVARAERAHGCQQLPLEASGQPDLRLCAAELDLARVWKARADGTVLATDALAEAGVAAHLRPALFAITATTVAAPILAEFELASEQARDRLVERIERDKSIRRLADRFRKEFDQQTICGEIEPPQATGGGWTIRATIGDAYRDPKAGSYSAFSIGERSGEGVLTFARTDRLRCDGQRCAITFGDLPQQVKAALAAGDARVEACGAGPFVLEKKQYWPFGEDWQAMDFYALVPSSVRFRFFGGGELLWEAR